MREEATRAHAREEQRRAAGRRRKAAGQIRKKMADVAS